MMLSVRWRAILGAIGINESPKDWEVDLCGARILILRNDLWSSAFVRNGRRQRSVGSGTKHGKRIQPERPGSAAGSCASRAGS